MLGGVIRVTTAFTSDTDARHGNSLVRRIIFLGLDLVSSPDAKSGCRGGLQEATTMGQMGHEDILGGDEKIHPVQEARRLLLPLSINKITRC